MYKLIAIAFLLLSGCEFQYSSRPAEAGQKGNELPRGVEFFHLPNGIPCVIYRPPLREGASITCDWGNWSADNAG